MPGAFVKDVVLKLVKENSLISGELTIKNKKAELKNISCNLLVISGESDQLVSVRQSSSIMKHAASKDKTFMLSKKGHTG